MKNSMEQMWNDTDRGETGVIGVKPVPVPHCPPHISHALTLDRTRDSANNPKINLNYIYILPVPGSKHTPSRL
jgi:hypothetical protein